MRKCQLLPDEATARRIRRCTSRGEEPISKLFAYFGALGRVFFPAAGGTADGKNLTSPNPRNSLSHCLARTELRSNFRSRNTPCDVCSAKNAPSWYLEIKGTTDHVRRNSPPVRSKLVIFVTRRLALSSPADFNNNRLSSGR